MKVKELVKLLSELDQELDIYVIDMHGELCEVRGAGLGAADAQKVDLLDFDWSAEAAGFSTQEEWEAFKAANTVAVINNPYE